MKAEKKYVNNKVVVLVSDNDCEEVITFSDERQMRRMGVCLTMLAAGNSSITIEDNNAKENI